MSPSVTFLSITCLYHTAFFFICCCMKANESPSFPVCLIGSLSIESLHILLTFRIPYLFHGVKISVKENRSCDINSTCLQVVEMNYQLTKRLVMWKPVKAVHCNFDDLLIKDLIRNIKLERLVKFRIARVLHCLRLKTTHKRILKCWKTTSSMSTFSF